MSRHVGGTMVGEGRMNDSSSSRESSPLRRSKRALSPASDDDVVVPPIPNDDSPPPERPLLRQPVGFAWSGSTSVVPEPSRIDTYEATLPAPGTALFLPGQAPILAASKKKGGGSKTKKADGPSKRRRTNAYAEQTSRFRLQAYDPSPSVQPVVERPLGSIFRGVPMTAFAGGSSSTTGLTPSYGREGSTTTFQSPTPEPSSARSMQSQFSVMKPPATGSTKPKKTSTAAKKSKQKPVAQVPPSFANPSSTSSHMPPPGRSEAGHYRPNFGAEKATYDTNPSHYQSPTPHHPRYEPDPHDTYPSDSRSSNTGHIPATSPGRAEEESTSASKRTQKQPLRMVTLLIQDIRSGVVDHQLAEVKIPLRPTEDPTDGFWADAKALGAQLQSGPSRIDGPAKVYTLRGKYRQFFLRVSAANEDEFISANLVVRPERTMDVVVEALLPPGYLPQPPVIPPDLRRTPTPESTAASPVPERSGSNTHSRPRYRETDAQRSPTKSPSAEPSVYRYHSRRPSGDGSQSETPTLDTAGPWHRYSPPPPSYRPESPRSDDEQDRVRALIVKYVDHKLQQEPGWAEFFRAKGAMLPQPVPEVLTQYRIVREMGDHFVGDRVPFRSSRHFIEMGHITEALKIDDPNFIPMCNETLALLDLYGPSGKRLQDEEVIAMINNTSRPEYGANPIKRMLHLMRAIDGKWREEHTGKSR